MQELKHQSGKGGWREKGEEKSGLPETGCMPRMGGVQVAYEAMEEVMGMANVVMIYRK